MSEILMLWVIIGVVGGLFGTFHVLGNAPKFVDVLSTILFFMSPVVHLATTLILYLAIAIVTDRPDGGPDPT